MLDGRKREIAQALMILCIIGLAIQAVTLNIRLYSSRVPRKDPVIVEWLYEPWLCRDGVADAGGGSGGCGRVENVEIGLRDDGQVIWRAVKNQ